MNKTLPKLICIRLLLVCVFFLGASVSFAHNKKKKDEPKTPDPEKISITTKDGIRLNAIYYAAKNEKEGKRTPPMILVHDWEKSSNDFGDGSLNDKKVARWMQEQGFAVLVPDLRGHGKSTTAADGKTEIEPKRMRKSDILRMIEDVEACKRYLIRENNKGMVNIELLTVVATGDLAAIACDWAAQDWSWPLSSKGKRQGQDVKAVVLLSPTKTFKGLSMTKSLKLPMMSPVLGKALPIYIMSGNKNSSVRRDTKSIQGLIEKYRGSALSKKSLAVKLADTSMQGAELANHSSGRKLIKQFISEQVLAERDSLRWTKRD